MERDVCRILIPDPTFTLPGLEQRIQVGRGQDKSPARSGYPTDFDNRLFRIGEVFNNVFNNDYTESVICKASPTTVNSRRIAANSTRSE